MPFFPVARLYIFFFLLLLILSLFCVSDFRFLQVIAASLQLTYANWRSYRLDWFLLGLASAPACRPAMLNETFSTFLFIFAAISFYFDSLSSDLLIFRISKFLDA
jgi:hypothetical protein